MKVNWIESTKPLIELYSKRKHPLDYENRYQLIVMVILSAQDSDKHINKVAREFFKQYPSMKELATAKAEEIHKVLKSVRNFGHKTAWLLEVANKIGDDENIPVTLDELTKLPGIGRKSANVIIRESGGKAEGIVVDLHVVRVAPRLGVADGSKPEKIEKQLIDIYPNEMWNEVGMAMSFLGREICRPKNPKCEICVMNLVCNYYHTIILNK